MKKLIALILLSSAFLGGYYLGHQPDSPDIFGWAGDAYHKVDQTTAEISDKAEREDTSLPEAAVSYAFAPATGGN